MVLHKISRGNFHIIDPAIGAYICDDEYLMSIWIGYVAELDFQTADFSKLEQIKGAIHNRIVDNVSQREIVVLSAFNVAISH